MGVSWDPAVGLSPATQDGDDYRSLVGRFVCIQVGSGWDEYLVLAVVQGHRNVVAYTTTEDGDQFAWALLDLGGLPPGRLFAQPAVSARVAPPGLIDDAVNWICEPPAFTLWEPTAGRIRGLQSRAEAMASDSFGVVAAVEYANTTVVAAPSLRRAGSTESHASPEAGPLAAGGSVGADPSPPQGLDPSGSGQLRPRGRSPATQQWQWKPRLPQHQQPPAAARSSAAQHSNVFVGDLQPGMDKTTLQTACSGYGRVVSCNFLPHSRGHAGRAALIKFETRQVAETAVETLVELGWTARFADRDVSVPRSASASRRRQSHSATPARQWRPKPAPSPGRGQTRSVLNDGADGVEVPILDEDDDEESDE